MKCSSIFSIVFFFSLIANAKVVTESVQYKEGGSVMEGFLAYDNVFKGKLPTVLLIHDWMGLGQNTKDRAVQVAKMGYAAFALDMYGKGVRPQSAAEAAKLSGDLKADRKLLRARALAGMEALRKNSHVDMKHLVAAGYCFGGTTALEMGRAGADLVGVVSFHGGLANPSPEDAKKIKGQVLVLHGAIDPYVNLEEVNAFEKEMNAAGANYSLIKYSGAVHSFTIKEAGDDMKTGAAYNANADRLSWIEFTRFLAEVAPLRTP